MRSTAGRQPDRQGDSMAQRLLVSVRGPIEALAAARGGAAIADVEYPASALGTPYPLNVQSVRDRLKSSGFRRAQAPSNNFGPPFTQARGPQDPPCGALSGPALR